MDSWLLPIWTEKYSVGNEQLDDQHKQLLECCRRAVKCLELDDEAFLVAVHDILTELMDYVQAHFRTEEGLMRYHGYTGYEAHRREHQLYEAMLNDFVTAAALGEIDKTAFIHYMTEWWVDHILVSDRLYKPYLSRTGDAGPR